MAARSPAPQIYEYSREAGPEETLFVVGDGLDGELLVWGSHPQDPKGRKVAVKTQFKTPGYLAFTIPDSVPDGIFVAAVKNKTGWSKPFVINAPEIWWCSPRTVRPGETVRIFGRNLARRPDFQKAVAELVGADGGKHEVGPARVKRQDCAPVAAVIVCHMFIPLLFQAP